MSESVPLGTDDRTSARLAPADAHRLRRLDRLAELLDESIRIPGIGYRIGYDAVIGLLPGIGDAAGLVVGTYVVYQASRFDIPRTTLLRMIANVVLEAVLGAIPLVGDLFDATYKSNLRNLRLLHRRLERPGEGARTDRLFFVALLAVPVLVMVVLTVAFVALLSAIL